MNDSLAISIDEIKDNEHTCLIFWSISLRLTEWTESLLSKFAGVCQTKKKSEDFLNFWIVANFQWIFGIDCKSCEEIKQHIQSWSTIPLTQNDILQEQSGFFTS